MRLYQSLHIFTIGFFITSLGLKAGLYSFLLALVITLVGYILLLVSLAELTSIVSFSGGAYGYLRCSVGPWYGFLVACSELLQHNFMTICSVYKIGMAVTTVTGLPTHFEPLWFFLTYIAVLLFHIRGGRYFWTAISICTAISITLILLFCIKSYALDRDHSNQAFQYGQGIQAASTDKNDFIHILIFPAWFFIGIETSTIVGAKVSNGPRVIPKALVTCISSYTCIAFLLVFAAIFTFQGSLTDLSQAFFPLQYYFGLSSDKRSRVLSALFVIPANFSSALGFIYASKHLTQALAYSGLFPPYFQLTWGPGNVPLRALLTCSFLQYIILLVSWKWSPNRDFALDSLFSLAMLGATVAYIGFLSSFIAFRINYEHMQRSFHSPFHIYGAVVGIMIFAFIFISIIGFHNKVFIVLIYLFFMAFMAGYYYMVAEARQYFSQEEQEKFMKAFIQNGNALTASYTRITLLTNFSSEFLLVLYSKSTKEHSNIEKRIDGFCFRNAWSTYLSGF